jgi:hypothetical protein
MAYVAEDVITIPKLQLTEKAKSPEYLGNSLKICPWGDYSLYYIQDDPHLRIADPGAIEDANFRPVGRADATALNFKACILGVIKEKIGGGSNNRVIGDNTPEAVKEGAEIFSKDFPPYLHGFISSAIRNAKTGTPGSEMHFVVTENLNAGDTIAILSASKDDRKIITTTPGGKYVIASDIHGKFVAFQTQDDTGKSWPPRNWRKYNLGSQITYPPDLEMYLRIVNENPGRNIVFLPEKYAVRTTDEHVEIIDTSLPFHQPPVMIDKTLSVEDNIYVDPNNSKVIYYCSSNNPVDIVRLDLSKSPETWQTQATKLPQQYKKISHLQLDPTGNLFVLQTETGVVFLEKDTLKEVYQYPGVSCPHFDSKGNLKVVNKEGKIVICGGNFSEVTSALEARRVQAKMGGFKVQDVFAIEAQQVTATVGADITERFAFLAGDRTKYELGFQALIQQIRNLSDVPRVAEEIKRLEVISKP